MQGQFLHDCNMESFNSIKTVSIRHVANVFSVIILSSRLHDRSNRRAHGRSRIILRGGPRAPIDK